MQAWISNARGATGSVLSLDEAGALALGSAE